MFRNKSKSMRGYGAQKQDPLVVLRQIFFEVDIVAEHSLLKGLKQVNPDSLGFQAEGPRVW
jgi:hypothetical protein